MLSCDGQQLTLSEKEAVEWGGKCERFYDSCVLDMSQELFVKGQKGVFTTLCDN